MAVLEREGTHSGFTGWATYPGLEQPWAGGRNPFGIGRTPSQMGSVGLEFKTGLVCKEEAFWSCLVAELRFKTDEGGLAPRRIGLAQWEDLFLGTGM